MKTIYLDKDFRCHLEDNGTTPIETDIFDGLCDGVVECYRYIPQGQSWKNKSGKMISGLYVAPFAPPQFFNAINKQYQQDKAESADMAEALSILGVTE